MADAAQGAAQGAAAGAAMGPYGALAGSLIGGVSGMGSSAAAAPVMFGQTGITFGSSNFKSAGAGDRGKSSGLADVAAAAGMSPAYDSGAGVPAWIYYVGGGLAVLALVAVLVLKKKK